MELLAAFGPDRILHAGDIGDLGLLDPLARIGPVLAVRGNIDPRLPRLPDLLVVELGSAEHLLFRILLLHIGLIGTRLRKEVALEARAEAASLVVCGHSHVPFLGKDRGLAVFNPGSAGPRRFSLPVVFGTIEVSGHEVRLGHIDCETGQPWQPPSLGR
jgi:putative phosphoesterase